MVKSSHELLCRVSNGLRSIFGEFSSSGLVVTGLLALVLLIHAAPSLAIPDETLGAGDSIRIIVFENPDLTTEARISSQGAIVFPLLGNVKLGGLTPTEAAAKVTTLLKTGSFIRKPQVSLTVLQVRSRQVSVLGQVVRPGRYALEDANVRLTDVLALAGGISPTGDDLVTVLMARDGSTEKLEIDLSSMYRSGDYSSNVALANGDTILVKRAPMFYIYGEVQRAGTYRLEPNMSVVQALSLGGGLTQRGTERGIKISRRQTNGSLEKRDARLGDIVQADDTIYIRESLF